MAAGGRVTNAGVAGAGVAGVQMSKAFAGRSRGRVVRRRLGMRVAAWL